MKLSPEALELLTSAIDKSGGEEKWNQVGEALRRVCKARDRQGIADYARRVTATDAGAVQLVILALLGVSLGQEVLKDALQEYGR